VGTNIGANLHGGGVKGYATGCANDRRTPSAIGRRTKPNPGQESQTGVANPDTFRNHEELARTGHVPSGARYFWGADCNKTVQCMLGAGGSACGEIANIGACPRGLWCRACRNGGALLNEQGS